MHWAISFAKSMTSSENMVHVGGFGDPSYANRQRHESCVSVDRHRLSRCSCAVCDPAICVAIIVFADEDQQHRVVDLEGHYVVGYALEAPPIDHLGIGVHVHSRVS